MLPLFYGITIYTDADWLTDKVSRQNSLANKGDIYIARINLPNGTLFSPNEITAAEISFGVYASDAGTAE